LRMFRIPLHTFRVYIYTPSQHDFELFDTYFISKCDCLSIHSSLPLGPRHHAIPQNQHNSFLAEQKRIADRGLFCRIFLKKPSFFWTDFSPSWTHKLDSLPYQILVLTLPTRRHPTEPRCYWKNLQMGSRIRRPQHRLQATNSHQVASTSRLHGRMAGESVTNSNRATRALGDVLRWLAQALGRGRRSTPAFS
jgi:hypothetical protein